MNKIYLALIFTSIFISSCSSINKLNNDHFAIYLERNICLGDCPVYQMSIYDDGTVLYLGNLHVEILGNAVAKLKHKQITDLIDQIRESNVMAYKRYSNQPAYDAPTVKISVMFNNEWSFVYYYLTGSNSGIPLELRIFECNIEKIVGTDQWTGHHTLCKNILK